MLILYNKTLIICIPFFLTSSIAVCPLFYSVLFLCDKHMVTIVTTHLNKTHTFVDHLCQGPDFLYAVPISHAHCTFPFNCLHFQ